VGRLGLIVGSSLSEAELPQGEWTAVRRHEIGDDYRLPHQIDHVATMRALADAGCDRVLALSSVGGLRPQLTPGTLVCPDDFIALDAEPLTALEGVAAHRVPGFDRAWRARLLEAITAAGIEVVGSGVYWQARGPRLETPAEIRLIAPHADVIGMTVASECVIAGELGLPYAALCVVDNLANGVGARELTLAEIDRNRALNRDALEALVGALLLRLAA
jgi:5'-methylthioadenosine phosphorylase